MLICITVVFILKIDWVLHNIVSATYSAYFLFKKFNTSEYNDTTQAKDNSEQTMIWNDTFTVSFKHQLCWIKVVSTSKLHQVVNLMLVSQISIILLLQAGVQSKLYSLLLLAAQMDQKWHGVFWSKYYDKLLFIWAIFRLMFWLSSI
jgi:hypothetical protein